MNKNVLNVLCAIAALSVLVLSEFHAGRTLGRTEGHQVGFAEGLGRPQTAVHLTADPVTAEACTQEEAGYPISRTYSRCIVKDKDGNHRFFSFAGAPVKAGDVISAKNGAGRQTILNGMPLNIN